MLLSLAGSANASASANFFSSTFGFEEGSSYVKNQANLLRMARFQEVPIQIPVPVPSASESSMRESSSSSSSSSISKSSSSISYFREQCDFTMPDGKTLSAGIFSMPTLLELRNHANLFVKNNHKKKSKHENDGRDGESKITVKNMTGESRSLHTSKEVLNECTNGKDTKAPVVVQAASQFNTLEFISPHVVPEKGISDYELDRTQGPACATACAAGTAYRNYLVSGENPAFVPPLAPVPVPCKDDNEKDPLSLPTSTSMSTCTRRGQTRNHQLNGLVDVENYLLQEIGLDQTPWMVKNGYVESTRERLSPLIKLLSESEQHTGTGTLSLQEEMISRVRIGVQQDTIVTDDTSWDTKVTQTYNSALSIGYSNLSKEMWQPLAQIILDATYEATLLVGVLQSREESPPPIVLLTKVGGGVFDNKDAWIRSAMARAIEKVEAYGVSLDIRVVHYGNLDEYYEQLESI